MQGHDFSFDFALFDWPSNLFAYELYSILQGFNVGKTNDALLRTLSPWAYSIVSNEADKRFRHISPISYIN
jgi:hypothetical protein